MKAHGGQGIKIPTVINLFVWYFVIVYDSIMCVSYSEWYLTLGEWTGNDQSSLNNDLCPQCSNDEITKCAFFPTQRLMFRPKEDTIANSICNVKKGIICQAPKCNK